jgi:hypothetical protein
MPHLLLLKLDLRPNLHSLRSGPTHAREALREDNTHKHTMLQHTCVRLLLHTFYQSLAHTPFISCDTLPVQPLLAKLSLQPGQPL